LTSFAGRTTSNDLEEAKQKIHQVNIKLLGTVLSNVQSDAAYYRYGYGYHSKYGEPKNNKGQSRPGLLLPYHKDETQ
jgi:Mrp family chromosome partitioning ATPase